MEWAEQRPEAKYEKIEFEEWKWKSFQWSCRSCDWCWFGLCLWIFGGLRAAGRHWLRRKEANQTTNQTSWATNTTKWAQVGWGEKENEQIDEINEVNLISPAAQPTKRSTKRQRGKPINSTPFLFSRASEMKKWNWSWMEFVLSSLLLFVNCSSFFIHQTKQLRHLFDWIEEEKLNYLNWLVMGASAPLPQHHSIPIDSINFHSSCFAFSLLRKRRRDWRELSW